MAEKRLYSRKRKRREDEDIEPLRKWPDYLKQRKRGSHTAAINLNRVYFVNEDYERLVVTPDEVKKGGDPTRFVGQLPFVPEAGDILSTDDFSEKFEVVRRHMIPNLSLNIPPKIYIVLKEI